MQTVNVRRDYSIDLPDYGQPWDIGNLMTAVSRSGSHFFDRDTMRSFKSRVDDYVFSAPDGWYFVTSEKHESPYMGINEPRLYTVRFLTVQDNDLRLYELEEFQHYRSLNTARTAARKAAKRAFILCPECKYRGVLAEFRVEPCAECQERAARKATAL